MKGDFVSLTFIKGSSQRATEDPVLEIEMTDRDKQEIALLLQRAEHEAISAIGTCHPLAAAAHFEMALIYLERAREALAE